MSKMKEGWEYKKLGEVCELYQPKTLSTKELIENGDYPVYGANGIIGRYSKYNHEKSEILMTCRGATCGTINISQPFAWINGNAMVIHPITDNIYNAFLVYQLKGIDLSDVITGAAQPQITRQTLSPKIIGIPKYSVQLNIVSELDLLSGIVEKQKAQLEELDKLAQSIFYDMFGDPVTNEKGWEIKKIEDVAISKIGLTYKPADVSDSGTIVLRSSNIQDSEISLDDIVRVKTSIKDNQWVKNGDILMCSRNGSFKLVGKVALINNLPEPMTYGAFMTIIRSKYNHYLFAFFKSQAFRIQLGCAGTATINQITVKMLNSVLIPLPPLSLQQEFAAKIEAIEAMKAKVRQSLKEAETLFNERMDYYFN